MKNFVELRALIVGGLERRGKNSTGGVKILFVTTLFAMLTNTFGT